MTMSLLTTGILTATAEMDDPVIETALTSMIQGSTKAELTSTVYEMTGLVKALSIALGEHTDLSQQDILNLALA